MSPRSRVLINVLKWAALTGPGPGQIVAGDNPKPFLATPPLASCQLLAPLPVPLGADLTLINVCSLQYMLIYLEVSAKR